MKIAIIGYSGSGKSTLARKLAEHYLCDVLHLDTVHFAPGWKERSLEEKRKDTADFLKKESWIIDGNYSKLFYEQRMEQADQIIFMNFSRVNCLFRAYQRYKKYKGKSRPDMTVGCEEKLDLKIILWILKDGRSKKIKERYRTVVQTYPDKTVVLKNQKATDRFLRNL